MSAVQTRDGAQPSGSSEQARGNTPPWLTRGRGVRGGGRPRLFDCFLLCLLRQASRE